MSHISETGRAHVNSLCALCRIGYIPAVIITVIIALSSCAAQRQLLEKARADAQVKMDKSYGENESFDILGDRVVQGSELSCIVQSDGSLLNTYENEGRTWKRDPSLDLSALPRLTASDMPILESLYILTQEETLLDIRADGSFMAGAKWPGVWTRDISYSIHLSLGLLMSEASKKSLLAKVSEKGQIIQDTGTGGSWPLSTDRVVWALAAWEIYLSTGDRPWLEKAYAILEASANKDRLTVYDSTSGLYRGESSFTDWREQTYPKWMQSGYIGESQALSTNVLHYRSLKILSLMARALSKPDKTGSLWDAQTENLAKAINAGFNIPSLSYLGAYRYSPECGGAVTDKSDTLANSLAVLLGVLTPEKGAEVIAALPVVHYGPPVIFPQMQLATPYHNKAVWPFVTAYYGLAGLKTGNTAAFDFALRSNIRSTAMFLTNKENFVYNTGHWRGTEVNSDRQLWSVAGFQAQIIKGIFGVNYDEKSLGFSPCKSEWIKGSLTLDGLKWRASVLNLRLGGNGNRIESLKVNGEAKSPSWRLDASASGIYTIEIILDGTTDGDALSGTVNLRTSGFIGPKDVTKAAIQRDGPRDGGTVTLTWPPSGDGLSYRVYKNGKLITENIIEPGFTESGVTGSPFYQIQAADQVGTLSNLSQPLIGCLAEDRIEIQAESGIWKGIEKPAVYYTGYQGTGFVMIKKETDGLLNALIPAEGKYLLRWRYSNGSGPVNTDNKAAVRSLFVNGKDVGTSIFAQTGTWSNWTWSNALIIDLKAGEAVFSLRYNPEDENMNILVNDAALDVMELTRL